MSIDRTVIVAYGVMEPDASVRKTTFKYWGFTPDKELGHE